MRDYFNFYPDTKRMLLLSQSKIETEKERSMLEGKGLHISRPILRLLRCCDYYSSSGSCKKKNNK